MKPKASMAFREAALRRGEGFTGKTGMTDKAVTMV
jgi:hypothetical protein